MATEEKGPGDLFRRIRSGFKAARGAYKTTVTAEKAAQLRKAKRAEAAVKAKATREANKAAKIKAAEEAAAAKAKRGRPKKSTAPAPTPGVKDLKEVKVSAPKTKGKKPTKKELAAKYERDKKIMNRSLIGAGIIGTGMIGYGMFGGKKKKKAIDDPLFQKQLKQYDDSLKKARGYGSGFSSLIKKKSGGSIKAKAKKR